MPLFGNPEKTRTRELNRLADKIASIRCDSAVVRDRDEIVVHLRNIARSPVPDPDAIVREE